MSQNTKKVLITGVAGFIGSNLSERLLSEGYVVIGLDNLSQGLEEQIPKGVIFHNADIRSKDIYPIFEGVDTVFHFSAKNSIYDCQQDPIATADINVTGTVNVFMAASKAKVRKVIYAETSAIYEGSKIFPTPEEDEHPESFYASSKLATKYFAQSFQKFHNLPMVALRYFNVYGPKQDFRRTIPPLMSGIIIKLSKGERPVIYGDGSKRRDFVYIDDVNDFHLLCMNDDRTNGKTFNIGGGKNYSVMEIYEQVAKILGTNIQPEFKEEVEGEAQENLGDISKAKALGWQPKTTLEEGLKKSVEYIRKYVL